MNAFSTIIFYLIPGILIFFLLKKICKKLFHQIDKKHIIICGLLAVLFTPTITAAIYDVVRYEFVANRNFTMKSWEENVNDRFEMRNSLIASNVLKNKSKTEITDIIGVPNNNVNIAQDSLVSWSYFMGSESWGFGIKIYYLDIEFQDGQSVNLSTRELID